MKIAEIQQMNPDEIQEKLSQMQKQLFELRCQAVTEKLESPSIIGNIKRDIARVKTVIRQMQEPSADKEG